MAIFEEVSAKYPCDLLIGDETYEINAAMGKRPELKKAPFVMIYDFVGLDAMSLNPLERLITYQGNWGWAGSPRGKPPTQQDLTLFIGEPEDVPNRRLRLFAAQPPPVRPLLPLRRLHLSLDPADYSDKKKVRAALGYDEERPLIVCSVGGTSVGADLLRLCAASYPHIQERVEDVRMMLVCGPRIDPASIEVPSGGVEVRGYVPRCMSTSLRAKWQSSRAGGTTTLELTALRASLHLLPS